MTKRMSFDQNSYMFPPPGGFWPPYMIENQQQTNSILISTEHPPLPPFKRMKNSENPSNFGPLPPNNNNIQRVNQAGNRGSCNIFYKTRLCAKFTEGTCRNGESCTFAHGTEDLREPPPNWQELVREKERMPGGGNVNVVNTRMMTTHRMKICNKYYNGEECPYGDKCNFLHERGPPRFKPDVFRQRERESSAMYSNNNNFDQSRQVVSGNLDAYQSKTVFWKTKLCSKWEIGQCPFGERCHYAHGMSELKASATNVAEAGGSIMNHGSIPFPSSTSGQSLSNLVIGGTPNESVEDNKATRWKVGRKINRIYGDWLDNKSPPRCSYSPKC